MPFASPAPAVHVREHLSVLAELEKRALVWLARRLPRSVTSDHLTLLGLGSMIGAGLTLAVLPANLALPMVVVCLVANWFGDSLDGTVARVRGHQRPRYGYYVDHVIDLAGTTALAAGLAAAGIMAPSVALAVLVGYLLAAGESFLATHAAGVFRMSFLGFGPTELRIVLAAGLIRVWLSGVDAVTPLGAYRLFDIGGAIAAAGLGIAFVVSAVRNTRALYRAEPLPGVSRERAA